MTNVSVFCCGFDCANYVTTEQVTKGGESLLKDRHFVFLVVVKLT